MNQPTAIKRIKIIFFIKDGFTPYKVKGNAITGKIKKKLSGKCLTG
jgi:hypothetical protein